MSEIKKKYEKQYNDFGLIRNTKYDISPKPNTVLRLLSEKKDFADAFFQTYSFLSKDKIKPSANKISQTFSISFE
jgi:hypothetical protein